MDCIILNFVALMANKCQFQQLLLNHSRMTSCIIQTRCGLRLHPLVKETPGGDPSGRRQVQPAWRKIQGSPISDLRP